MCNPEMNSTLMFDCLLLINLFRPGAQIEILQETGEFSGHTLKKRGALINPIKIKEQLTGGITEAINVRFKDLKEDLKPTMLGSLQNCPTEPSEGFSVTLDSCCSLLVYCFTLFGTVFHIITDLLLTY